MPTALAQASGVALQDIESTAAELSRLKGQLNDMEQRRLARLRAYAASTAATGGMHGSAPKVVTESARVDADTPSRGDKSSAADSHEWNAEQISQWLRDVVQVPEV